MRRMLNKIRIFVLKAITAAAFMGFIVAGSAVDSKSIVPLVVCFICFAWLALMAAANWRD